MMAKVQNDDEDVDAKWVCVVQLLCCSVGGCFVKTKLTAEGLRQPPRLDLTVHYLQRAPFLAWHRKMPGSFEPSAVPPCSSGGRAHGGCSGTSGLGSVVPGAAAQGWQQLVLV